MLHTHKHYHNLSIFSLSIIVLGGAIGAAGGQSGRSIFMDAGASSVVDYEEIAEERTILLQAKRREAFRKRMLDRIVQRGGIAAEPRVAFPIQASILSKPSEKNPEVALGYGTIRIPSLQITAPINRPSRTHWDQGHWKLLEEQMQFGHNHGVSLYPHGPVNLWNRGNFIITGHSSPPTFEAKKSPYGEIFATLPGLRIGDIVEMEDALGNSYTYEITETKIVHPSETSILRQGTERELTLMTCYPVGTTRSRFIAKGKPVGEKNDVAVR